MKYTVNIALLLLGFNNLLSMDKNCHPIDINSFSSFKIERKIPNLVHFCLIPAAQFIRDKIKNDSNFTFKDFKSFLDDLKCKNLPALKLIGLLKDSISAFNFKIACKPSHQETDDMEFALYHDLIIKIKNYGTEWTKFCTYNLETKENADYSFKFDNHPSQPLIFSQIYGSNVYIHTCFSDIADCFTKKFNPTGKQPETAITHIAKKYKKNIVSLKSSRGAFYLFYFDWIFRNYFEEIILEKPSPLEEQSHITALHHTHNSLLYVAYKNKQCAMWDLNLAKKENLFITSRPINSIKSSVDGFFVFFQHEDEKTVTFLNWKKLHYKELELGKIITINPNSVILSRINNELRWTNLDGSIIKRFLLQEKDQIIGNSMELRSWKMPSCLLVRQKKIDADSMNKQEKKWHDLNLDYKLTFFIPDLLTERKLYNLLRTPEFNSIFES